MRRSVRPGRLVACGVLAVASLAAGAPQGSNTDRIRGVDGRVAQWLEPAGAANVIFFVATDCPISNSYAPEIQRLCRDYGKRGVSCVLIYEDVETPGAATPLDDLVRRHLREYRYDDGMPAVIDRTRTIARRVGARVTPHAIVIDRSKQIRYRGRIDNFYAAFGKPRQQVTERDLRNALDAILAGDPVPKRETEALGCYIVDPAVVRK